MIKTWPRGEKSVSRALRGLCALMVLSVPALSQRTSMTASPPSEQAPHRTRLILKDGSYQIVMSYRINGDRVLFISAERGGTEEQIPVALVDFDATHRWEQKHAVAAPDEMGQTKAPPPAIDPELQKDEDERRSLTPEVAPDLRLPEQESALALDTYQGTAELVPLTQSAGDLNQRTSHNLLRSPLNPLAASHMIVQLRGEKSMVQLHVNQPVLYMRLGDESGIRTGSAPLMVDTHGASQAPAVKGNDSGGSAESQYVVVRVDVRQNARVVASFSVSQLGEVRQQDDVVETITEILPGGHWLKVTPRKPLSFGEYALMEILSPRDVNLGVWDFGIHPTAPDNRDALKPVPSRPVTLERRGPE